MVVVVGLLILALRVMWLLATVDLVVALDITAQQAQEIHLLLRRRKETMVVLEN